MADERELIIPAAFMIVKKHTDVCTDCNFKISVTALDHDLCFKSGSLKGEGLQGSCLKNAALQGSKTKTSGL